MDVELEKCRQLLDKQGRNKKPNVTFNVFVIDS